MDRRWLCITRDRGGSVYHVDKSSCKTNLQAVIACFYFLLVLIILFVSFFNAYSKKKKKSGGTPLSHYWGATNLSFYLDRLLNRKE